MTLTLQNARDALENLKKDITDVGNTEFIEWCKFVNSFVYRELYTIDPERFISTSDITTVSGTASYSLPNDFETMQPYGCGLFYVDDNGDETDRMKPRTGFGSRANGYYISGSNVVLTPEPTLVETWRQRYIPTCTAFTALTDYFTVNKTQTGIEIIPDEYLMNLRDAINVLYEQWDEDPNMEYIADHRFIRSLGELLKYIRREPNAYAIKDYSTSF